MSTTLKKNIKKLIEGTGQKLTAVRVIDIILDINHPKAIEFGGYDSIGTIFYTILENNTPLEEVSSANIARPMSSNIKHYPLKNEIVLIISSKDKDIYNSKGSSTAYYFSTLNIWNHPHHNALPSVKGLKNTPTEQDYEKTEAGIVRKVTDEGTDINLGKYFSEALNIKPLLPYEGDYIIEGRFGNSIRLGSTNIGEDIPDENNNNWSNIGNTGDPITIIRNGQSNDLDNKGWVHTVENINDDLTSLYLTSNQQLSNFRVASTNFQSYQAKLVLPEDLETTLTDPQLNIIVEPELPVEDPLETTPTISTPPSDPPILSSPPVIEEEEGEQSPFDLFMTDPENFSIQEIEGETEDQTITPTSIEKSNPNNVETDTTGPIDNVEKVGKYFSLEKCFTSKIARTGIKDGEYVLANGELLSPRIEVDVYIDAIKRGGKSFKSVGCNNLPGIDGYASKETIINNLKALFENVVDKIYEKYPNMEINSAYRTKLLNDAVGSNDNSNHLYGQAIDIKVPGVRTSEVFNWIVGGGIPDWHQVIWEYPENGERSWVHIAYMKSGNKKKRTLATSNSKLKEWNKAGNETYSNMITAGNLTADQSKVLS